MAKDICARLNTGKRFATLAAIVVLPVVAIGYLWVLMVLLVH